MALRDQHHHPMMWEQQQQLQHNEEASWFLDERSRHEECPCYHDYKYTSAAAASQSIVSWEDWMNHEQYWYQKKMGKTTDLPYGRYHPDRDRLYGSPVHMNSPRNLPMVEFPHSRLLLKRVLACVGWAVHGLIFEFVDGTRTGYCDRFMQHNPIYDDDHIQNRQATPWVNIARGDYVTAISGFDLSRKSFLCHTLRLHMASGQIITFCSQHEPWKGQPFQFQVPDRALLHHISFDRGTCCGLDVYETGIHLPVCPLAVAHCSLQVQERYQYLLMSAQIWEKRAGITLGTDVWRSIMEYLVCHDLEV